MNAQPILGEVSSSGGLLRIGLLGRSKGNKVGIRDKVTAAIHNLELHKKEVQTLRKRLQDRSNRLFENVVVAIQANENDKATIYANENIEIKKIMGILWTAELALTQFVLRLESIRDVGEAVNEMSLAFGVIKGMEKTLQGFPAEMSTIQSNIQNTLTEMMSDLGQIAPDLHVNLETSDGEQILEEAMKYLDEQIVKKELSVQPSQVPGSSQFEEAKKTALLASAEDEDEDPFKISLVKVPAVELDEAVSQHLRDKSGRLDVYETAAAVGAPVDDVEKTVMKLVSEGRLKLDRRSEQA